MATPRNSGLRGAKRRLTTLEAVERDRLSTVMGWEPRKRDARRRHIYECRWHRLGRRGRESQIDDPMVVIEICRSFSREEELPIVGDNQARDGDGVWKELDTIV